METKYINSTVRAYHEKGELVAVATSIDGFDNFINYFCLPDIWDQQSDTSWVSKEELERIIEDNT